MLSQNVRIFQLKAVTVNIRETDTKLRKFAAYPLVNVYIATQNGPLK
jgi:hypothetical protein